MAVTQISDIFVAQPFTRSVINKTTTKSALWQSGIVRQDAELDALASGQGKTFDMPYWNDLGSSESNVGSDDPASASTPENIDQGQDVAVKHYRNQSWSSMDLSAALADDDPLDVITDLVAAYWMRDFQNTLISSLTGVIADNVANDSGDMVYDIANDSADAVTASEKISATTVIQGLATFGDNLDAVTAIAMHSVIYWELVQQDLIDFRPDSEGNPTIPFYLNKRVIVDDGAPAVSGSNRITYTTYLFGTGAFGFGEGEPKTPSEVERNPDAGDGEGQETLYNRRHYILHPRGIKFLNASIAGKSPTNAELDDATEWDRVYDRKKIRIAAIKTNG